ncbi:hypothetical protein BGZ96_003743 [Linnemannia gamsii]|uniref:Uncharacterized protein n=1 Tax=Linnemannia gamsii TaxID=64522 RepID=A0ABQ7JIW2_9FUNG|nr:hypothetical protein BGZ96_003743 [Linnemannia gamsii]
MSPVLALRALASLCRANSHISRVTIPFLYNNPFHQLAKRGCFRHAPRQCRALVRSLVTKILTTQVHPALLLGLDVEANITINTNTNTDTRAIPPSRTDYIGCIRHLDIGEATFLVYAGFGKSYSDAEKEYIEGHEFQKMYFADRKYATCLKKSVSNLCLKYYPNVLLREATWTLAAPILDQLESFTIHLSDLERYHRLQEDETMRHLIQFVKDHIRTFPGRLKTVNINRSEFWKEIGSGLYSKAIEQGIFRMLPDSFMPTYFSRYTWYRISAIFMTTNLSQVGFFDWAVPLVRGMNTWFGPEVDHQNFLQRCRSLTKINAYCLVQKCFDWAVQEKKDFESRRSQGPTARSSNAIKGLVPLSEVVLGRCSLPVFDLDALAFAFSQSLKRLDIAHFSGRDLTLPINIDHVWPELPYFSAPDVTLPIHIGHGWRELPLLTVLSLRAPRHRIALDPLLLAQCRSLTEVKITDGTYEYSYQDMVPCLPTELPRLRKLYLKGWSALTFHADTLNSTKELIVLKLSMHRSKYCFIPPVAEVNGCCGLDGDEGAEGGGTSIGRPRWTWSWHLPHLKNLVLTSEFAYRFEFKMLQGCPALEYLRLHMRTTATDGDHTRVISERDLYVDGKVSSSSRIVAPSLRKLYMNGRWFIESTPVLSQFLGQMFPNLERLTARGWQNVSVGSLVEVLRTEATHIDVVRTDMEGPLLSDKERRREMGMVLRSDEYMKPHEYMRNRFFCSEKEYFLYRK